VSHNATHKLAEASSRIVTRGVQHGPPLTKNKIAPLLLLSKSAPLIWVLRGERVIQEKDNKE